MSLIGYVILEYNQAGGPPEANDFVYDSRDDAARDADLMQQDAVRRTRGEKYRVAALHRIEES